MLNATITERHGKPGEPTPRKRFAVSCEAPASHCGPITIHSADPEYDLCHRLIQDAYFEDTPITFWRNGAPAIIFPSVKRAALRKTRMDEGWPRSVRRKEGAPVECSKTGDRSVQDARLEVGW